MSVVALLNGIEPTQNVFMDAEQDVKGNRVSTTGNFEFIISREKRKICIIEVKRELFDKGTVQRLTGCEAVADVDDLNLSRFINHDCLVWNARQECWNDGSERRLGIFAHRAIKVGEELFMRYADAKDLGFDCTCAA